MSDEQPPSGAPEANKDISMVDVSKAQQEGVKALDLSNQPPSAPAAEPVPIRRKSTLILTDDLDFDRMKIDEGSHTESSVANSSAPSSELMHVDQQNLALQQEDRSRQQDPQSVASSGQLQQPLQLQPDPNLTLPVDIKWVQGGDKVYVTGSFTGWRKMIGLLKQPDNNFMITLGLPVGTHRFRFVVDNELRFSDYLPSATDQMGNFVNYIEVTPEHIQQHLAQVEQQRIAQEQLAQQEQQQRPPTRRLSVGGRTDSMWGLTNDDDDMGGGYSRYHDEDGDLGDSKPIQYISDIPPIFTDPKVMEQYYQAIDKQSRSNSGQQQAWLHPPQLPPHLENVVLNNFNSQDRDNNAGALPIPNHVVLNHLATTSIKHNTLAVASVVRYKRKYVTQILYAPLQ